MEDKLGENLFQIGHGYTLLLLRIASKLLPYCSCRFLTNDDGTGVWWRCDQCAKVAAARPAKDTA